MLVTQKSSSKRKGVNQVGGGGCCCECARSPPKTPSSASMMARARSAIDRRILADSSIPSRSQKEAPARAREAGLSSVRPCRCRVLNVCELCAARITQLLAATTKHLWSCLSYGALLPPGFEARRDRRSAPKFRRRCPRRQCTSFDTATPHTTQRARTKSRSVECVRGCCTISNNL